MKITFNPSTVAALTSPPNNKDITFDLKGHNIFARGVEFKGTDTNTWRDIKINNVSIGSNILDLYNGTNTTLTNINGVVTINSTWRPIVDNLTSNSTTSSLSANQGRVLKALIDGKSDSGHNHDDRYLRLIGGTLSGALSIITPSFGALIIQRNDTTNGASIQFKGSSSIYGYIGFNKDSKDKQLLRWNSSADTSFSILDTSTTYVSSNKGYINGTEITQVNNANKWTAARTFTIGNTSKNVDGSNNVSWSLSEIGAASSGHNHDGRYVRAFGTSNDNIDSDWGQSFKTFDPIPSGTPPEKNPNISLLSIGENFSRRKQLAFVYSSDNIYYRRHVDDGFTNWKRIAFANEIPSSLKNPHALTISLNGTSQGPYDGSVAMNINITPGSIGAATSDHNHDGRYVRYYAVTTLDCNNLAEGLTVASVNATNAGAAYHSAYLYISDVGTPFQIQIPDSGVSYIYKRYYSSGKWSGWFKLNAGYADSAGSVAWADVTGKPDTATRWPSWKEVTNKPDIEYIVPTLSHVPTSSTLTFVENGITKRFKIGYMCRVADSFAKYGYKFYQLYNISGNNAVWGENTDGDYNETVIVNVTSNVQSPDNNLIGAVVTIKNTSTNETQTQTWKGTVLIFKIPAVNTYTVSVSNLSNYTAPVSQSYTAGISASRNVIMHYIYYPIGIFIQDIDTHFITAENWNTANNNKAVGVYVGTENSKFVIAPVSDDQSIYFGASYTEIPGVVITRDIITAKEDYAGETNTDKIITKVGAQHANAAQYCRNYTFKNGKKGYLWSLGEAFDACSNMSAISKAMDKLGIIFGHSFYLWTSTQYSDNAMWCIDTSNEVQPVSRDVKTHICIVGAP